MAPAEMEASTNVGDYKMRRPLLSPLAGAVKQDLMFAWKGPLIHKLTSKGKEQRIPPYAEVKVDGRVKELHSWEDIASAFLKHTYGTSSGERVRQHALKPSPTPFTFIPCCKTIPVSRDDPRVGLRGGKKVIATQHIRRHQVIGIMEGDVMFEFEHVSVSTFAQRFEAEYKSVELQSYADKMFKVRADLAVKCQIPDFEGSSSDNYVKFKSPLILNARDTSGMYAWAPEINDYRADPFESGTSIPDGEPNLLLQEVLLLNWPYLFIVADEDIAEGDELLLDYGKDYWNMMRTCHQDKAHIDRLVEDIAKPLGPALHTATQLTQRVQAKQAALERAIESLSAILQDASKFAGDIYEIPPEKAQERRETEVERLCARFEQALCSMFSSDMTVSDEVVHMRDRIEEMRVVLTPMANASSIADALFELAADETRYNRFTSWTKTIREESSCEEPDEVPAVVTGSPPQEALAKWTATSISISKLHSDDNNRVVVATPAAPKRNEDDGAEGPQQETAPAIGLSTALERKPQTISYTYEQVRGLEITPACPDGSSTPNQHSESPFVKQMTLSFKPLESSGRKRAADALSQALPTPAKRQKPHSARPLQEVCQPLLETLWKSPELRIFHEPVNAEKYPMYLQIVENPMDLGTIKKNVEANSYKDVKDFVSDTLLIFANCLKFNPDPHLQVHRAALKGERLFLRLLAENLSFCEACRDGLLKPDRVCMQCRHFHKRTQHKSMTLQDILKRFIGVTPENAVVGRWRENGVFYHAALEGPRRVNGEYVLAFGEGTKPREVDMDDFLIYPDPYIKIFGEELRHKAPVLAERPSWLDEYREERGVAKFWPALVERTSSADTVEVTFFVGATAAVKRNNIIRIDKEYYTKVLKYIDDKRLSADEKDDSIAASPDTPLKRSMSATARSMSERTSVSATYENAAVKPAPSNAREGEPSAETTPSDAPEGEPAAKIAPSISGDGESAAKTTPNSAREGEPAAKTTPSIHRDEESTAPSINVASKIPVLLPFTDLNESTKKKHKKRVKERTTCRKCRKEGRRSMVEMDPEGHNQSVEIIEID
ncbi:hypothetical protein HDU85_006847 [Gaertneriomyces sp. JEL0708]|nr:hypothetical protein HDU85_006847 [Gaertneriomyces sp. JEL0708]